MGFFDLPAGNHDDEEDLDQTDDDLPGRWMGGVVPLEAIIARSEIGAIAVCRVLGFPDGFELEVVAWLRKPPRPRRGHPFSQALMLDLRGPFAGPDDDGRLPDELVRFGVLFPDGVKVTNLDDWPLSPGATAPVHGMDSAGSTGSDTQAQQTFWVWPVPDHGDVVLVCEWPAAGIAETRLVLDGDHLRAAAARAEPVWPDEARSSHQTPFGLLFRTGGGHSAPAGTSDRAEKDGPAADDDR
jgi:hypothetical protein